MKSETKYDRARGILIGTSVLAALRAVELAAWGLAVSIAVLAITGLALPGMKPTKEGTDDAA